MAEDKRDQKAEMRKTFKEALAANRPRAASSYQAVSRSSEALAEELEAICVRDMAHEEYSKHKAKLRTVLD